MLLGKITKVLLITFILVFGAEIIITSKGMFEIVLGILIGLGLVSAFRG